MVEECGGGESSMSYNDYKNYYDFMSKERLIEIIINNKHEINRLKKIERKYINSKK